MHNGIKFSRLKIEGWRQFNNIDIEFHPNLTVITGTNGSGKSTLLSILTQHFGWQTHYLSIPTRSKLGGLSYTSGFIEKIARKIQHADIYSSESKSIGELSYSNQHTSGIFLGGENAVQYGLRLNGMQQVQGIHVDSYRPPPTYTTVGTIPLTPMTAETAYSLYNNEIVGRHNNNYHHHQSPIFRMKEAIISMAVFGRGNSDIGNDPEIVLTFEGFNEILRQIFPEALGFERISVRAPEVVLVTRTGEFMLDAASGGIMTLMDIAWRIHMFSRQTANFVVTMDEPENHLHPAMQRSLMRRLIKAFPQVQFVIATHSPFMISSVKESNVYVLKHEIEMDNLLFNDSPEIYKVNEQHNSVVSIELNNINKAAPAGDILRDVLGVPATMPEWVEDGITDVVKSLEGKQLTSEILATLRARLSELGYSDYYPEALASLLRQ